MTIYGIMNQARLFYWVFEKTDADNTFSFLGSWVKIL